MNSGLSEKELEKLKTVFCEFPQIHKVVLYGSRAKGTYKPSSDIDLTIVGDKLSLRTLSAIENRIDDLLLPYKVDLSDFKTLTNPHLIEHINRVGITIFETSPNT
jgi:predicted nucleotidyltransferase